LKTRRGILLLDTLLGMFILILLATVLVVTASRARKLDEALARGRSATRLCEVAMADLLAGHAPTADARIRVRRLSAAAPSGFAWVEVEAAVDGARRSLTGLAPVRSVEGGTP
jgi:hypothetical protein